MGARSHLDPWAPGRSRAGHLGGSPILVCGDGRGVPLRRGCDGPTGIPPFCHRRSTGGGRSRSPLPGQWSVCRRGDRSGGGHRHACLRSLRPSPIVLDPARRSLCLCLGGEGIAGHPGSGTGTRPRRACRLSPPGRALLRHHPARRREGGACRVPDSLVGRTSGHRDLVADSLHGRPRALAGGRGGERGGSPLPSGRGAADRGKARIGIPLSGGLDSRICLAAVPEERRGGVTAFTWGDPGCLDRVFARSTARRVRRSPPRLRLPLRRARQGSGSRRVDHRRACRRHRLPHPLLHG